MGKGEKGCFGVRGDWDEKVINSGSERRQPTVSTATEWRLTLDSLNVLLIS